MEDLDSREPDLRLLFLSLSRSFLFLSFLCSFSQRSFIFLFSSLILLISSSVDLDFAPVSPECSCCVMDSSPHSVPVSECVSKSLWCFDLDLDLTCFDDTGLSDIDVEGPQVGDTGLVLGQDSGRLPTGLASDVTGIGDVTWTPEEDTSSI